MSKKIKPNRYRPASGSSESLINESGHVIDLCLKCIMTVALISILSLFSIFIYEFVTQSSYFQIQQIDIIGTDRVQDEAILKLAGLAGDENIFIINLHTIENQIASHPWIQSATAKRNLKGSLSITIVEQKPLAIVKIANLANILINTKGKPFKEYNPSQDHVGNLPVISGIDLTRRNDQYMFYGPLFNSIYDLLTREKSLNPIRISAHPHTGLTVEVEDIYNTEKDAGNGLMKIKLGFSDYKAKLAKARELSLYIDKNYPNRAIVTMDLFDIHKVFIKTRFNEALHTTIEKGV